MLQFDNWILNYRLLLHHTIQLLISTYSRVSVIQTQANPNELENYRTAILIHIMSITFVICVSVVCT